MTRQGELRVRTAADARSLLDSGLRIGLPPQTRVGDGGGLTHLQAARRNPSLSRRSFAKCSRQLFPFYRFGRRLLPRQMKRGLELRRPRPTFFVHSGI